MTVQTNLSAYNKGEAVCSLLCYNEPFALPGLRVFRDGTGEKPATVSYFAAQLTDAMTAKLA